MTINPRFYKNCQFPKAHAAQVQIEKDESGQTVEKRIEFSYNKLDYIFVFSPAQDDPAGGPTLTYVGDETKGRLSPSEYAANEAWDIASAKMKIAESLIIRAPADLNISDLIYWRKRAEALLGQPIAIISQ